MSLKEQLQTKLAVLSGFTNQENSFEVTEGGNTLTVDLVSADQLAISFTKFSLNLSRLADASIPTLQKTIDDLCRRLTYLLEPIRPYEFDSEHCAAQLRSMPPQKDETGTTYYEILVKKDGVISLVRYQKVPGNDRKVIPATLTREVFLRLVGDFEYSLV